MVTVMVGEGAPAERVLFGVSALAELGAGLHVLTAVDHGGSQWGARMWSGLSAGLRVECALFTACWGGYRSRLLFPLSTGGARVRVEGPDRELAELAAVPTERAMELIGCALSGVGEFPHVSGRWDWVRRQAWGRGAGPAAELLLADPDGFLRRLVEVLSGCWEAFFAAEWEALGPRLHDAAVRGRRLVGRAGAVSGLAALTPVASVASGPRRVVFDKLHHGVVDLGRTPLLVLPTVLGAPHVLVKHEAGWPAVLQYPVIDVRADRVPMSLLSRRLEVLADPLRLRVCRAIGRNQRSTTELAEVFGMSPPEMSRHLRALREAGLVARHRSGRFVYYTLRHGMVERLGSDVLDVLLR